jgi:hypothetical protein
MMQPMAPLIATAPSASDGYFEIVGVWPGSCRRSFARCGVDQRSDFRLVITEHLFASDPVGRLSLKLERLPTFRCGEVDGGAHGEGGQALVEPLTLVVVVVDFDNVKHPPFGGLGIAVSQTDARGDSIARHHGIYGVLELSGHLVRATTWPNGGRFLPLHVCANGTRWRHPFPSYLSVHAEMVGSDDVTTSALSERDRVESLRADRGRADRGHDARMTIGAPLPRARLRDGCISTSGALGLDRQRPMSSTLPANPCTERGLDLANRSPRGGPA